MKNVGSRMLIVSGMILAVSVAWIGFTPQSSEGISFLGGAHLESAEGCNCESIDPDLNCGGSPCTSSTIDGCKVLENGDGECKCVVPRNEPCGADPACQFCDAACVN